MSLNSPYSFTAGQVITTSNVNLNTVQAINGTSWSDVATKDYVDAQTKIEELKTGFMLSLVFTTNPDIAFKMSMDREEKEKGFIEKLSLREYFTEDQKKVYDTMKELIN